jgi:hypothetical protein
MSRPLIRPASPDTFSRKGEKEGGAEAKPLFPQGEKEEGRIFLLPLREKVARSAG